MTIQEPPVATDMTKPMPGNTKKPSPPPSNFNVAAVMIGFVLVAFLMLGIGYIIGRAAESSGNDDGGMDIIRVNRPNAVNVRQTEVFSYNELVTQNALLSEQVGASQRSLATTDAQLRDIAPAYDGALQTITALEANAPAASVPVETTPPPPPLTASTTQEATPLVNVSPDPNTPIQGLLPGEVSIAVDSGDDYRFDVAQSTFLPSDTLPDCGRIVGQLIPDLSDRNEDYRIEWRHTNNATTNTILTRGGVDGAGRFTITVPSDFVNGVFIIQAFDGNGSIVAPVVTVRFPADCTGYRLELNYNEPVG